MEPNMSDFHEMDLSSVDLGTLAPDQWDLLKREVNRRAHAARAAFFREMLGRLRFRRRRSHANGFWRATVSADPYRQQR
jgi:hypothetical protein